MKIEIEIDDDLPKKAIESFEFLLETLKGKTKTNVLIGCNLLLVIAERCKSKMVCK